MTEALRLLLEAQHAGHEKLKQADITSDVDLREAARKQAAAAAPASHQQTGR